LYKGGEDFAQDEAGRIYDFLGELGITDDMVRVSPGPQDREGYSMVSLEGDLDIEVYR